MARNYFKRNFVDAVEIITPDLYLEDDFAVSGVQIASVDELINSHLISAENVALTLGLSSIVGSNLFSSLGNINGFSQYFIKQNKLTNITTQHFQDKILTPLNIKISSYSTSGLFATYLSGTLLPKLYLKSPTLLTDTSSVFGTSVDATVKYLIQNLGWLALLNSDGPVLGASSIITSSIIEKLYNKNSRYQINDGVKDYQDYLWQNYSSFSSINPLIIPERFTSGTGTYTSGNQNLAKLKTLVDVVYSPLTLDLEDTLVESSFQNYITTSSLLTSTEYAGPFSKFLRGIAYGMYDVNDQVQGIENLLSVDDCPAEYLPLLAEMIGWKLYGKNEQSWRNQIQNAASIYRKRGTQQGLVDAFNSIIIQNPINTSGALTELYESYLPNLIFYALMTESPLFVDTVTYTHANAIERACDWKQNDIDYNVKAAVDKILEDVVANFPDLFYIKNEPFRITRLANGKGWFGPIVEDNNIWVTAKDEGGILIPTDPAYEVETERDPAFVFNYRGRDHLLPPWDEEKFYANCDITLPLISYIKNRLDLFCVPKSMRNALGDYVYQYTVSGHPSSDLYIDNGFVFFTSSQHFAPNTNDILAEYDAKDYDYLSLWNGKSSTFDFGIHGGEFISEIFGDVSSIHTVEEILQSLSIVGEMTPAKAIPKVKFSKAAFESASGADYACPSVRIPFQQVQDQSGAIANTEVCGVFDRGTGYALGHQIYPGYDDSRSTYENTSIVSHANLPVFDRAQSEYGFNVLSSVVNTSATVPATSAIPRRTIRRRNFQNAIPKSGWFDRAGRNMPTFYNNTSSLLDFVPLGYNASTGGYAPPTDENLSGVYGLLDCSTTFSDKNYFGVDVSNTFLTRANDTLTFSSCDQFVRRSILPEALELFFNLEEKRKYAIATDIINSNYYEIGAQFRSWENLVANFANVLPDAGYEKYYSPALDIRKLRNIPHGVHYLYGVFNHYFSGTDYSYDYLPENFLRTYKVGGPNILSHTYGPTYRNANFSLDGSALIVSSQLISNSLDNIYPINIAVSSAFLGNIGLQEDKAGVTFLENTQYSTKHILSGIAFIDASTSLTPTNEFVVLGIEQQSLPSEDEAYLINNRNVLMRSRSHGLPRIRFGIRGSEHPNILLPEHDFELTLNYLTSEDNSNEVGKSGLGVMLHTKQEYTVDGRNVMFVWTKNNEWEMVYTSDLRTANSRDLILTEYTHSFHDATRPISDSNTAAGCGVDDVLRTLDGVNKDSYSTATIKFNTSNKPLLPFSYGTYYSKAHSDVYNGRRNYLHRANLSSPAKSQNYYIEIFALPTTSRSTKFTLLDNISVVDTTLNDAAQIPYGACIPDLTKGRESVYLPTLYNTAGKKVKPSSVQDIQGADILSEGGVTGPNLLLTPSLNIYWEIPQYPHHVVWEHNSPLTYLMKNTGGCLSPRTLGTTTAAALPGSTYKAYRPLPYTGCYGETWTSCQWGFDNYYGGAGSVGALQGFATVQPDIYEGHVRDYFESRGAMYTNTGNYWGGTTWLDASVGTWASYDRWSDLVFNGQIPQAVDWDVTPTWDPGPLGAGADPSGITNRDILHPIRGMQAGTTQSQKSFGLFGGLALKNPIGYSAAEDSLYIPPGRAGDCYPIGSPTMLCFISRRYDPNFPTSPLKQIDSYYTKQSVAERHNWIGAFNLWNSKLENSYMHVAADGSFLPFWGIGKINSTHNFNRVRAMPPPQGIYYDTHVDKLLNGEEYTFTAYIAKPPMTQVVNDSWGYPNGDHGQSLGFGGKWEIDDAGACTSAFVTLSPIDSSSTYSRAIVDLDTGNVSADRGGSGLTATVSAITYTNPVSITWYKMQVKIKYDALEKDGVFDWEDPGGVFGAHPDCPGPLCPYNGYTPYGDDLPNYGIRCCIQGLNTRADYLIQPPADPAAPIDIPGCLMVWGTSLTLGDKLQWSRAAANVPDAFDSTVHPQILYTSYGVDDDIYYDNDVFPITTDQIINVGSNGELSYTNPATSSLDKITISVPADDTQEQKLYTSSLLYDISGNRVTDTQIVLDSTERLMLSPQSVHHNAEYGDNLLDVRHEYTTASQGTNINFCTAGTIPLEPKELLHLFRYFNYIGQAAKGSGINTRVPEDSSGIHCVSGGSRLSYRVHPDNTSIGTSATDFHNFTKIEVTDG